MSDIPTARPDKAARQSHDGHALCSRCNNRLAYLWSFVILVETNDPNSGRRFPRTILLPAEWTLHDDGIWRAANHTYQGQPSLRRLYNAATQQSKIWQHLKHEIKPVRQPTHTPIVCQCNVCKQLQILDPATLGVSLYFSVSEEDMVLREGLVLHPNYDIDGVRRQIKELRGEIDKVFGPLSKSDGGRILYLLEKEREPGRPIHILLLDEPLRSYLA